MMYASSMIIITIRSQDHNFWEGNQHAGNSKQFYHIYQLQSPHKLIISEHQSHETLLPYFYEARSECKSWLMMSIDYSTLKRCRRL